MLGDCRILRYIYTVTELTEDVAHARGLQDPDLDHIPSLR